MSRTLTLLMLGTVNHPHVEHLSLAMNELGHRVVVGGDVRYAADTPILASLRGTPASRRAVNVQTIGLDSALREHGIEHVDLLKMDIEGAELDVLSGFEQLDRVETIVGELHPSCLGEKIDEVLELLSAFKIETEPAGDDIVFCGRRSGVRSPSS